MYLLDKVYLHLVGFRTSAEVERERKKNLGEHCSWESDWEFGQLLAGYLAGFVGEISKISWLATASNPARNPAGHSARNRSDCDVAVTVPFRFVLRRRTLFWLLVGTLYRRFIVSFRLTLLGSECLLSQSCWAFGRVYVCSGSVVPARVGQVVRQTLWFTLG